MIDVELASRLLDFDARINSPPRAREQLVGAVALHNMLTQHRVAYLADEVGMGKTYVALGAVALFRHFNPHFRILVLAPRRNIQDKWQKELRNFTRHNVRFDDLRTRNIDGSPARSTVSCNNLLELTHEASLDPHRDFFARLTSFSLPLGNAEKWSALRDRLKQELPWLRDDAFELYDKNLFKRHLAKAVCCALPKFDLVIVDEAHNLKHGVSENGSSRNQVLAEVFGRGVEGKPTDLSQCPSWGPRAGSVLFLSATPLEDGYRHLWNQLDLFGLAQPFDDLKKDEVSDTRKREVASQFLVRRVTSLEIAGKAHTKNMYRREWRGGGVAKHDEPINITDERQRLVVALVQKKVSELLSAKKFNRSFQIGMLASFESFLETARLKKAEEDVGNFDDGEQAESAEERTGIDVRDLNLLSQKYRQRFGREMPHPKMDEVVDSLASAWTTGKKTLVFVRRVASVKELKRKLDECYDDWVVTTLRAELDSLLVPELDAAIERYRGEKNDTPATSFDHSLVQDLDSDAEDTGGLDTFFAWYFRGKGPSGLISGANVQLRFAKETSAYSTVFLDNHVSWLLGVPPAQVITTLGTVLGLSRSELDYQLRAVAAGYLRSASKRVTTVARFEAAQAAALELLGKSVQSTLRTRAERVWAELYAGNRVGRPMAEAPPEILDALETETFFSRLRLGGHEDLRRALWADPIWSDDAEVFSAQFRLNAWRADVLAAAARLGHASLDLYIVAMKGRPTLKTRSAATLDEGAAHVDGSREAFVSGYIERLDAQRRTVGARAWAAFDELAEISQNFELLVDVNLPEARSKAPSAGRREAAKLLRSQQPTGGMAGKVNPTLIRQFRMPGYPLVLVTTDLLQEGEDLHTFCSSVMHYGISWTPSSMEQRTGRIDRVRSHTERRLAGSLSEANGHDLLQVYFPYLEDTVEVLQVERVLGRMNRFLRLMHEGIDAGDSDDSKKIDVQREMVAGRVRTPVLRNLLRTAFPVPAWATKGTRKALIVAPDEAKKLGARFDHIAVIASAGLSVTWQVKTRAGLRIGTATLASGRIQPFTLVLRMEVGRSVVRCISPIGRAYTQADEDDLIERTAFLTSRVGAILTVEERSYDMTIEDDVLLGESAHDDIRVSMLIRRVVEQADQVELDHYGDGRDEPLSVFEEDLKREGFDGE